MNLIEIFLRLLITFIIAIILGKLLTKIGLPSVLGWLIAGITLGPYAFGIINETTKSYEAYKDILLIAEVMLGMMIGYEIMFKDLKETGKEVSIIGFTESVGTYLTVALGFIIFFLIDTSIKEPILEIVIIALLFGGISMATAPGPSVIIVKENNAKGPISKSLLILAALDDIIALVVFSITLSFARTYFSGGSMSLINIVILFAALFLSVGIGVVAGVITYNLHKLYDNKWIGLVTTLLINITIGYIIHHYNIGSPLIFGLSSSLVMNNLMTSKSEIMSKKQKSLANVFLPIVGVFLIIYIIDTGTGLDYKAVAGTSITVLIYVVFRTIGKIYGTKFGAHLSRSNDSMKKYLGFTLLPHAGVSLFLLGKSLEMFEQAGNLDHYIVLFSGTIAAAAIINEILAVLLAKRAFVKSGEIKK